jgi:hypothetical protein
MKKCLLALAVCFSSFCFADWVEDQVTEDLATLAESPMTIGQLKDGFRKLCKRKGAQAAYFSIKGNKVRWKRSTPIKNEDRMPKVYEYLKTLTRKYSLPDMDVIISTHDGEVLDNVFPLFAFAKKEGTRNVVLFPDMDAFDIGEKEQEFARNLSEKYPWAGKKNMGFFRGSTTGECEPSLPSLLLVMNILT